ncbi:MAG: cytochrome c oxidase subunit 3 [Chitinophagales bacterium]|nr:cytochrome c oxidase subunit 3 [Bacteroidota bacterium]
MSSTAIKYKNNTQGAHRFTMYLFIVTTSMIFAGFTSAFIVQKGRGGAWTSFGIPKIFILSTILIITSSIFLQIAHIANKRGNMKLTTIGLFLTLVLGSLFCVCQIEGWKQLNDLGVYLSFNPNPAGPYFLVITFVHALHVSVAVLFLTIAFFHSLFLLKKPTDSNIVHKLESNEKGLLAIRTDLLTLFWHFMGILWLYLYIFLSFNL